MCDYSGREWVPTALWMAFYLIPLVKTVNQALVRDSVTARRKAGANAKCARQMWEYVLERRIHSPHSQAQPLISGPLGAPGSAVKAGPAKAASDKAINAL